MEYNYTAWPFFVKKCVPITLFHGIGRLCGTCSRKLFVHLLLRMLAGLLNEAKYIREPASTIS